MLRSLPSIPGDEAEASEKGRAGIQEEITKVIRPMNGNHMASCGCILTGIKPERMPDQLKLLCVGELIENFLPITCAL